jgi:hypothetical protein
LYRAGLWLAVNIAPGRSSRPEAKYSMSVVASPMCATPVPRDVTPSVNASTSDGDEGRASRPTTIEGAPENSANAAPMRRAASSSNSSG